MVAGVRPVCRKDVAVPATEPTGESTLRIRYLSGSGPVRGRDQWKLTEFAVEGPATSPVGRSTGGWVHGAQTTRPAARPSTTTAASSTTGHRRLCLRGAAAAGAAVAGAWPMGGPWSVGTSGTIAGVWG